MFAGIDWGGTHHQICIRDSVGKKLVQNRIRYDIDGFAKSDAFFSLAWVKSRFSGRSAPSPFKSNFAVGSLSS